MVNHLDLVPQEALGPRFDSHQVLSIPWVHDCGPNALDLPDLCGGGALHGSRGLVGAKSRSLWLSKKKKKRYLCT